jgi:peptidoglycan hydrolase FlgJ
MLKSMRQANAAFEEGGLFESKDSLFYRDMYDQQLSIEMSKGRGIGIAKALERQLAGTIKPTHSSDGIENSQPAADNSAGEIKQPNVDWRRVVASPVPHPLTASAKATRYEEPLTQSDWLDPYLNMPQPQDENPVDVNIQLNISSPQDFIDQLLPYAKVAARSLGVNPLALIAQAAMETGWGKRMVSDSSGNSSNSSQRIGAVSSIQLHC